MFRRSFLKIFAGGLAAVVAPKLVEVLAADPLVPVGQEAAERFRYLLVAVQQPGQKLWDGFHVKCGDHFEHYIEMLGVSGLLAAGDEVELPDGTFYKVAWVRPLHKFNSVEFVRTTFPHAP